MKKMLFTLLLPAMLACKKDGADVSNNVDETPLPSNKTTWWQPRAGVTFDWYLDDLKAGDTFSAEVVDVDAFTTSPELVAQLHAQGKKVIAYVSMGTIENDRPDARLLPKEVIGKTYRDWPKEKWLDIRQLDKLKPWLTSRFNMIISKGFDALEPDNLDSYTNDSGFAISEGDVRKYCDLLIDLSHKNGLGIGQKNVQDLTDAYSSKFDWALTEDAFKQQWQDQLKPYIALHKPVFAVEYTDVTNRSDFENTVCPRAKSLGYFAILKNRSLDKPTINCQ